MPVNRLSLLRPLLLTTALAVAGVGACSGQTPANAQTPLATQPAAPAPELVVGLPDFTRLVDQVGPAVVNVQAEIGSKPQANAQARRDQPMPDDDQGEGDDEIPEFFRRFFGPGMSPMPGMPGMPGMPNARPRGTSLGTGFIISPDGYVLTNHHVIDGADTVRIKLSDRREFTAKVVGSDEQSDVALLKIDAKGLPVMRIGDSATLKPGQWVVAIGSPFGLDHSVTAGIVSAVGRANPAADQRYVPFIQTDVAINRGNSGGPLLDTRGQVVGINSQIFSNSGGYMGVSFAIPIDLAMGAVKQLKATGKVQRGMIGVGLQPITTDVAQGMGLPDTRGALIREVSPGSAGEKAGLRVGDVIRSVDGRAVGQSSELPPIIGAKAPGTHVRLGVLRDGKSRDVDVVLSQLDENLLPGNDGQGPQEGPEAPSRQSSNPLGLVGEALDAADRKQLGLQPGEGVGIARVEGLAARSAGVRAGDVVLKVGRDAVGSPAELDRALRGVRPGQTVMLLLSRNGTSQFVAVTPRADDEQ
jgi:serine protease Do